MIRKYLTILAFTVTFGPIPYQSGLKSVQVPLYCGRRELSERKSEAD